MAVTLPTMAQWVDEVANLTQLPNVAVRFLNHAPIVRAFGPPRPVAPGKLKVKWSDGATAGTPATTAGMGYTGTVGQVNDSFTLDFGVIAAPASEDYGTKIMGPGLGAMTSADIAVASLYKKFINELLGSNSGTDYNLWGATQIVSDEDTALGTTTMHVSGSYTSSEYDSDKSLLLDAIDSATAEFDTGDGSYRIGICDKTFYKALKKQLRAAGGNLATTLALAELGGNFDGYDTIVYDGTAWFRSDNISNSGNQSKAYIFKVGGNGCYLAAPSNTPFIDMVGPKLTKGELNEEWDIVLAAQIIPQSPRSVAKLTQIVK